MGDGFLARYNEELANLRQRAARFATMFPKIAGRLRLSGDVADDPHVERLIQSFAYSAARIRQKLDDEFPELTSSLLETLYPHYLAPLPSMSIVQFMPSATLASLQRIARHSEIVAAPLQGESCRFRTTQDVDIAPVELVSAKLSGQPIDAPPSPHTGAAGCLRLSLRSLDHRKPVSELKLSRLRLHLSATWTQAITLHALLCNRTLGVALARHSDDPHVIFLPASSVKRVGFDEDQTMLPYAASSFIGYGLLTEFFALPQKFLFIDIDGLDRYRGNTLEIFIYLSDSDPKLERTVSTKDFALHATPVINLFDQACEPLVIDGTRTEYRLLPDARRQQTREVHAVKRVTLSGHDGREQICQPFFGRTQRSVDDAVFWQISRRFDTTDATSDVDIAFVDPSRKPTAALDAVASVDVLCMNRDLPEKLPFGGGHPQLKLATGNEAIGSVIALMPPTASVRLTEQEGQHWRLLSHLNLNHLSLFDNDGAALKDLLGLYAFRDAPETRQLIDAIIRVDAKSSTARLAHGAMVSGTDITLEFDPAAIDRASAILFSSVLERFFALYASVNSFTRLTAMFKGHTRPIAQWPARAAMRPLL